MNDKLFGLIGFPLKHSFSLMIHRTAYELLGMEYDYNLFELRPGRLDHFVTNLPEKLSGFNITFPFKEDIYSYLTDCDEIVQIIKCCNTVLIKDTQFYGYNTDVNGISYTCGKLCKKEKIKRVLIFGAGGAAKAAAYTLATQFNVKEFHILSRLPVPRPGFGFIRESEISFYPFDYRERREIVGKCDLVINCTPLGMFPNNSTSPVNDIKELHPGQHIFDMVYNPAETKLMQQAKIAGATAVNGLEMLIVQAAEAFKIFTGREMPINEVHNRVIPEISKRTR